MKRKIKIAIVILLAMAILIPVIWIGISFAIEKSKYRKVEKYYFSNEDSFNAISSYFKGLYSDGMYSVQFNLSDAGKMEITYHDSNGRWLSTSEKDVSNEKLTSSLAELRQKYGSNTDDSIFSSVYAYYDKEGDMLLIIPAYSGEVKEGTDYLHTPFRMKYYLVYYDEECSVTQSFLGIDNWGGPHEKPFSDRWCTWSEKVLLG